MKTVKIFYFKDCKTIDEVKKLYRDLAKELHPDRQGGDTAKFQDLGNEYTFVCAMLAQGGSLTGEEQEATILQAEAYKEAIEKVIVLEGIIIEIVGAWIWITGDTRTHADYLKSKENGPKFWFASKKVAWYFRTDEYKSRNRTKMSLDEIRRKYGSQSIPGRTRPVLHH